MNAVSELINNHSTQECIPVWQGKNGKNGTGTGFVDA